MPELTFAQKSAEEYNAADREGRKTGPQSETHRKVAMKLEEIAKKKDTAITSIALAYVMHKAPVFHLPSPSTQFSTDIA